MNIQDHSCSLIDRFPLKHRIIMQTGWYGFIAIGLAGVALQSQLWALIYFVFVIASFFFMVLPSLCSHCPYPEKHDTCLFLPPSLIRKFYPYRGPRMSRTESLTTLLGLAGIVIFPQAWLYHSPLLFIIFWAFCLPSIIAFPLYYCKRCRHEKCPMNNARRPHGA